MTLPTRGQGESGALHLADHNAMHARHNQVGGLTLPADGYPASTSGPLAEMYNAMMAHFDGARATAFFVNVQHPDFGATGRNANHLNEAPAIQSAIDFLDDVYPTARTLWFPAIGDTGERSRYYVDVPLRLHSGLTWWAYGARIAASPRFDFVTKFPTVSWLASPAEHEQAILESYNITDDIGRFSQCRLTLRGGLIEGMEIPGSIGAIMNLQQQSSWFGVRINDFNRTGMILGGQQGIFHDLMLTPTKTDPSAAFPVIGLQLGIAVNPVYPASFFWFYGTNIEGCYRAVYHLKGVGANVFRDVHIEGVATADVNNPAYCFHLSQGQLIVDQAWWTAEGGNPVRSHGTFLHRDDAESAYHLKDIFVQQGGPPNDESVFINDIDREHVIQAWGDPTVEEGIVRHVQEMIGPRTGNQTHVITILHDEGGLTAFGSYDSSTADAAQRPLLRIRPGATQMGHLTSWYDKAGVERHLITADGMPKLPAYTSATKPTAVNRQAVMIYDLDTNKVQISDGSTWNNLH